MNPFYRSFFFVLATIMLLLIGCADDPVITEPETEREVGSADALAMAGPPQSLDRQLLEIAQQVPGFGGMFYDEQGQLTVFLKETEDVLTLESRKDDVRAALTAQFTGDVFTRGADPRGARGAAATGEINVLPGQYDIPELLQWRRRMNRVLNIPGVVLTDLDEQKNRLRIGLENATSRRAVEAELARLGIPEQAVLIEEVAPIRPLAATLNDRVRPAAGGLEIASHLGRCTLGFNALGTFATGVGFFTASHCTMKYGGVGNTRFSQPSSNDSNDRIGIEMVDPEYVAGGACPAGRICRYSDAAFALYDRSGDASFGTIARVVGVGTTGAGNVGSKEINSGDPHYRIVAQQSAPVVGEVLDKIGRTTGHTYGTVSQTCVDLSQGGKSNKTLLCQDIVTGAMTDGGDSGSPVFKWSYDGNVTLYGIVWGGDGYSQFLFSALWNIERDMGQLEARYGTRITAAAPVQ